MEDLETKDIIQFSEHRDIVLPERPEDLRCSHNTDRYDLGAPAALPEQRVETGKSSSSVTGTGCLFVASHTESSVTG